MASAIHSGEAGPSYRLSGWSIVPTAAQYGTGSLYATAVDVGIDVQPDAAADTAISPRMRVHFGSMRHRHKARRRLL